MSATVDSRVVEMHFDNSDFMDKIQETIDALEKLNTQIESLNSSNISSNLGSGIDDSSLSNFNNELSNIESRFSVLDVVGMSIINRLTNAAITSIHNVYNAMTRDFSQGGMQRALNLEQAEFLLEGLGANVQGVMKDVDNAVTGTSYGLDEAAKAASSFYASGVEAGPKMESSLRAVAGVAAMTGSDFASIADIFTTTAGQGKVMTMQLRMLEGRGLNAAAVLAKQMHKTEEEIRDMVTKGEIDFKTFSKAMDEAFGEHAKDANKTFTGALSNMQTALKRMGAKFYVPGLVYARDIFNELREVINSFSNSLDKVAVDAFKNFGKSSSQALIGLLKALDELHTFESIGSGMSNLFASFLVILKSIGKAFNQAFPSSLSDKVSSISELAKSFESLSAGVLYKVTYGMQGFINIVSALFSAIGAGFNIIKSLVSAIMNLGSSTAVASHPLLKITELIRNFFDSLNTRTQSITIFETISKTLTSAGNIISQVFDMAASAVGKFIKTVSGGIASVNSFEEASTLMGLAITAIFADQKMRILTAKFNRFFGKKGLFGKHGGIGGLINNLIRVTEIPAEVLGTFDKLSNQLRAMTREVYAKSLLEIAAGILAIAIALKIMEGLDADKLWGSMAAVTVLMGEMAAVLVVLMTKLSDAKFTSSLKGIYALGSVTNALMKIGVAMILMAKALQMIGELKPEELARGMAGLTIMLGEMLLFAIMINKYGGKISGETGLAILAIAESLKIMSEAVQAFSALNPGELAKGLGSVTILMGAIFGMIAGVSKVGGTGGAGMAAAGAGMILIAASIRILAPAVAELGGLDLPTIGKGLLAISVGLGAMTAASRFASLEGGAGILLMSLGLSSLSVSIQRLGGMDTKELAKGLLAIAIALGIFAAAGYVLAPVAPVLMEVALAMLALSGAVAVLGMGLTLIGMGLTSISAGILSFSSVTQTALFMFLNVAKTIILEMIKMLPTVMVALAEAVVQFIESLAQLAPRLREAFTKIVTEAIQAFEDNIPRLVDTGIRFIVNLMAGIEEAAPRLVDSALNIISTFIDGIASGMEMLIESGINLMLSFINGLAEGVRAHKNDVRNAIINLCTAILEAFCAFFGIASPSTVMAEQGANLIKGLANGISKTASRAKTALVNAIKTAFNAVVKFGKKFLSAGASIISSIVSGIKSKVSSIGSTIKNGVTSAISSVKSTVSSFISAGRAIVSGIANGIRNGVSSVISAVGSIASRALSHFKSKLGISSPSKEFAKLGARIPEGTVKGIKDASRTVYQVVDKMGSNTISRMRGIMRNIDDALSINEDYNPTITPVLDLSEVERESEKINSLLSPNSIEASYATSGFANVSQNSQVMLAMSELAKVVNDNINRSDRASIFNITNNVDGAENPEQFASRFVRQLELEMRTGYYG